MCTSSGSTMEGHSDDQKEWATPSTREQATLSNHRMNYTHKGIVLSHSLFLKKSHWSQLLSTPKFKFYWQTFGRAGKGIILMNNRNLWGNYRCPEEGFYACGRDIYIYITRVCSEGASIVPFFCTYFGTNFKVCSEQDKSRTLACNHFESLHITHTPPSWIITHVPT